MHSRSEIPIQTTNCWFTIEVKLEKILWISAIFVGLENIDDNNEKSRHRVELKQ